MKECTPRRRCSHAPAVLTRAGGAGWQRVAAAGEAATRSEPGAVAAAGHSLGLGATVWGEARGGPRCPRRKVDECESHAGDKNHKHCIHTHTHDKHHT